MSEMKIEIGGVDVIQRSKDIEQEANDLLAALTEQRNVALNDAAQARAAVARLTRERDAAVDRAQKAAQEAGAQFQRAQHAEGLYRKLRAAVEIGGQVDPSAFPPIEQADVNVNPAGEG